jgi:SHAQKYF class myb-like DNA-binding protein
MDMTDICTSEAKPAKRPRKGDSMVDQNRNEDEPGTKRHANASVSAAADSEENAVAEEVFVWDESVHRAFVVGIYELGLKHASPAVIMEKMTRHHPQITSERVKSHLQKYRNKKSECSKEQFLSEYDVWMQRALTIAGRSLVPPKHLLRMLESEHLLGGELPAFLTYCDMYEDSLTAGTVASLGPLLSTQPAMESFPMSADDVRSNSQDYVKYLTGARVPFPVLSEEERRSPLGTYACSLLNDRLALHLCSLVGCSGISISHVMALFCSMNQHLVQNRRENDIPAQDAQLSFSGVQSTIPAYHPEPHREASRNSVYHYRENPSISRSMSQSAQYNPYMNTGGHAQYYRPDSFEGYHPSNMNEYNRHQPTHFTQPPPGYNQFQPPVLEYMDQSNTTRASSNTADV